MDGFLVALRAEIYVSSRSVGSKIVLLLPAVVAASQLLLVKITAAGASARDALLGDPGFGNNEPVESAFGYLADGLGTGLTLLGLSLVALAAYSFAYDRDTGVIRHLLIRRSSRIAVVLAKLAHLHLLALLSMLLLLAVAWLVAGQLWAYGPVVEDGYELIGVAEIRRELFLGLHLAILPVPAAIAFGLLISVFAQSTVQAVASALGVTLAMDIFKPLLGDMSYYVYATFQPSLVDQSYLKEVSRIVRGYSDILIDERVLQLNLWVPLPEMVLLVIITLLVVRGRKI